MEMQSALCIFTLTVTIVICACSTVLSSNYYTAAVFEHARQGDFTKDTPRDLIQSNFEYYERATAVAKEQGANMILFPEYGIIPPIYNRSILKNYLESIPNPKQVRVTPCDEASQYSSRPIILTLSCMAKNNNIVVVANMGGRQACSGQQDCPDDGEFHLNTNVAFNQNGTLIARYYKERLFYEFAMDLPKDEQDPVFETDFGKFAMFIRFDMYFKKVAVTYQRTDIDAILLSTMVMNFSPFLTSIQRWQAWAMGNNATLLAANIQIPGYFAAGSGIYQGLKGSIVSAFNPDGISKLMIATVPKRGMEVTTRAKVFAITKNETQEWNDNGKDLPPLCSYVILGRTEDIYKKYRCVDEEISNFTIKKLTEPEGYMKLCNDGMCCELNYSADSMNESFYLGVFNGTRPFFERYVFSEEDCFLARCDDVNGTACSTFPMHSNTVFRRISMKANFTTKYVYPSLMSHRMELVPVQNWNYKLKNGEASIAYSGNNGIRLLRTTLMGRAYHRDPPYVR